MNVLFIAPASNLSTNAELAGIVSGITPEIVDGEVDRAGLERALRPPYDAVHFIGHSGKGVLQLTKEQVDEADLVSMLGSQARAKFFFLNSCDSHRVGTAIHNELHVPVIVHDDEIGDEAAKHFATVFYRRYRRSADVGEAFTTAKESLLRLYPLQAAIPVLINGDMTTNAQLQDCMAYVKTNLGEMRVQLSAIEADVKELKGAEPRLVAAALVLMVLLLLAQIATPWLNAALRP